MNVQNYGSLLTAREKAAKAVTALTPGRGIAIGLVAGFSGNSSQGCAAPFNLEFKFYLI